MSRFVESRRSAVCVALAYALLALCLISLILRRAYVSSAIARPIPFTEMQRICGLDSSSPDCATRLAIRAEQDGEMSPALWAKAVELNRQNSSVLIQAALAYESASDMARAETLLLEAARHSRTWLPRWSLANFYHRRGEPGKVAKWARLALERGYGDRTPLFELCRAGGLSYLDVLDKAVPAGHAPSIEAYAEFLRSQAPSEEVMAALASASSALRSTSPDGKLAQSSVDQLVRASDYLLQARKPDQAYQIWNWLRGLEAFPQEYRQANGIIADATFTARPLAAPAFSWVMAGDAGVEIHAGIPPGLVKLEFTGRQPDSLTVLSQCIRLEGGRTFRLSYEASGSGDSSVGAHFRWTLSDWISGNEIAVSRFGDASIEQWNNGQMVWRTPAEVSFYRLALIYARPLGSARLTGELRIRSVRLEEGGTGP